MSKLSVMNYIQKVNRTQHFLNNSHVWEVPLVIKDTILEVLCNPSDKIITLRDPTFGGQLQSCALSFFCFRI